jgi:hypothetical protein
MSSSQVFARCGFAPSGDQLATPARGCPCGVVWEARPAAFDLERSYSRCHLNVCMVRTRRAFVAYCTVWDDYIDPAFRECRPRFIIDDNGKGRLSIEGTLLGNPRGIGSLGSVGVREGEVKLDSRKYADGRKGGFDPRARIADMEPDGIGAAFLYPSLGLSQSGCWSFDRGGHR